MSVVEIFVTNCDCSFPEPVYLDYLPYWYILSVVTNKLGLLFDLFLWARR